MMVITSRGLTRSTLKIAVPIFILIGALIIVWTLDGRRDSDLHTRANDDVRPNPFRYTGAGSCSSHSCHGGVSPRREKRVWQNEFSLWVVQDKHAKAYDVLLNETSRRMARILNLTAAEKSEKCLACHATNVPIEQRTRSFDISDGVSCESCHGPAEKWLGPHTSREWTHEQSLAAGMYDTKDIVKRAELCLTCHLGTAEKWVDHEMIAAGHPDLIFELDTYTAVMPPHWRETEQKGPWFGVRAWAVGQAVALREAMHRLARRAGNRTWEEAWPELAEFNCTTCHHGLRQPSWRQARGYRGTPGYPTYNASRYTVFRHLVALVAPDVRSSLDRQVNELGQLLQSPQRHRREIAARARSIAALADDLIPRLVDHPIDESLTGALLRRISGDGRALAMAGIRSAEQAAMALETLYATYSRLTPTTNHRAIKAALSRLFDELEDPARFDPARFARHMRAVHRLFQ